MLKIISGQLALHPSAKKQIISKLLAIFEFSL